MIVDHLPGTPNRRASPLSRVGLNQLLEQLEPQRMTEQVLAWPAFRSTLTVREVDIQVTPLRAIQEIAECIVCNRKIDLSIRTRKKTTRVSQFD